MKIRMAFLFSLYFFCIMATVALAQPKAEFRGVWGGYGRQY